MTTITSEFSLKFSPEMKSDGHKYDGFYAKPSNNVRHKNATAYNPNLNPNPILEKSRLESYQM